MGNITKIEICNFMDFENQVIVQKFEQQNILAGLYNTVKKTMADAMFFGLSASTEQLSVAKYSDLKSTPNVRMYVVLSIKNDSGTQQFRRTVHHQNQLSYSHNGFNVNEKKYCEGLEVFGFKLCEQMLFCVSSNGLSNMLATRPLDLISTVTGLKKETNAAVKHSSRIKELTNTLERIEKSSIRLNKGNNNLNGALPEEEAYAERFAEYIISKLKREEAERVAWKAELEPLAGQEDALNNDIRNVKATIERETERRNQKVALKQTLLDQIEQPEGVAEGTDCALILGIHKLSLRRSLDKNRERVIIHTRILDELKRRKKEAESNITFMRGASGTRRKRRMIPQENLLKLYPIFHGNEELQMDKLELQLIKAKAKLTKIRNEREIFDFFEEFVPQRKMKEMDEPKSIEEILRECVAAQKDIFHPKAYMPSNDELKLKKLRSLIPSDKGFLLNGTFRATVAQNQPFIENILDDYSSVIVLFENKMEFMYRILKKKYAEWYQNVTFLVLSKLPKPRRDYVAPQDHWLNLCDFTHTSIDDANRQILMNYLGKTLDIYCVESGEDVKDEFLNATKRYVASLDGQFIYARNSFGIDVIKYIRPGKTPQGMRFGEAAQRLEEAISKLSEFTLASMGTEKVRREPPVSNSTDLEEEVHYLEQQIAEKQGDKNVLIEELHSEINAEYGEQDEQDYDARVEEEQGWLASLNERITEALHEIDQHTREAASCQEKIDILTEYIELKKRIAANDQDIGKHNRTIKGSEQQLIKLNMSVVQLKLKCENLKEALKALKYKTVKTVLQAHQENVDCTTFDCITVPPTLWQDIQNGIYVDPQEMQINFHDTTQTFDENVFYASRKWYAVRNACQARVQDVNESIDAARAQLENLKARYDRLRAIIVANFVRFGMQINGIIKDIGRLFHPNDNMSCELNTSFEELLNNPNSPVLKIKVGTDVVGFKSLSKADRLRTSWILFAALNEYSKAPIAFIDLQQMDKEAGTLIRPIIERMSTRCQLFIDSSSTHFSHLANVHYGLNPKDGDGEPSVKVIRHDGTKFVLPAEVVRNGNGDQGGDIVDQGGDIVDQGGDIVDQGGDIVDQGGDIVDQGGDIVDQGGDIVDQGGDIVDQGGDIVDQGGDIVDQGGDIADQGDELM